MSIDMPPTNFDNYALYDSRAIEAVKWDDRQRLKISNGEDGFATGTVLSFTEKGWVKYGD